MNNNQNEVFCSTCLKTTTIDPSGKFQCSNPRCHSRYYFRVFSDKKEALLFYNSTESWRPKSYFTRGNQWLVTYFNDAITPFIITKLSDVIDSRILRILESGISDELGSATTILEGDGNRIDAVESFQECEVLKIPRNCSPFCLKIRTTNFDNKSGNEICEAFDREIFEKVKRKELNTNDWYVCWAGLIDFTTPIEVAGIFLGLIFSGQIRLKGNDRSGRWGSEILLEGIQQVNKELAIDNDELMRLALGPNMSEASALEINGKYIPNLKKLASIVQALAYESYRIKRREIEDLFLEEIAYQIEYGKEELSEFRRLRKVLTRLCDFFHLEQCYFILTYRRDRKSYQIMNKGRGDYITEKEREFTLTINEEQLERQHVTLVHLTKNRFPNTYYQLENMLNYQKEISHPKNIYLGNCPLPGNFNAFWVFVNPMIKTGLREKNELSELDIDFLRRFCVTTRERMSTIFSSHILLRKIGHELGSSIQAVLSGEETIINNINDHELIISTAKHNITELTKYHFIKENLRSIFVKGDRSSYFFTRYNLKRLVRELCDLFREDAREDYGVILNEPDLRDNGWIEMSPEHIRIVFYNMIQNGIKYSFKNHYIGITGHELLEEKRYCVTISNFGVGMTQAELTNRLIFQEGYRGVLSCDRNRSGNGLGLAIADQIVRNHNGTIQAFSYSAIELSAKKGQIQSEQEHEISIPWIANGELKYGFLNIFKILLPIIQN